MVCSSFQFKFSTIWGSGLVLCALGLGLLGNPNWFNFNTEWPGTQLCGCLICFQRNFRPPQTPVPGESSQNRPILGQQGFRNVRTGRSFVLAEHESVAGCDDPILNSFCWYRGTPWLPKPIFFVAHPQAATKAMFLPPSRHHVQSNHQPESSPLQTQTLPLQSSPPQKYASASTFIDLFYNCLLNNSFLVHLSPRLDFRMMGHPPPLSTRFMKVCVFHFNCFVGLAGGVKIVMYGCSFWMSMHVVDFIQANVQIQQKNKQQNTKK